MWSMNIWKRSLIAIASFISCGLLIYLNTSELDDSIDLAAREVLFPLHKVSFQTALDSSDISIVSCYLQIIRSHSRNYTVSSRVLLQRPGKYLSSTRAVPTRLGNHLFEFASLYGIAKQLNRTPIFWIEDRGHRKLLDRTDAVIPGLVAKFEVFEGKVPSYVNTTKFHEEALVFDDPKRLEGNTDEFLHLSGMFYQSWKYFAGRRDELRSYLKPQKQFRILPKSDENTIVTCVHTRRTDFITVGYYASEANFIRKAVEFIENRERSEKHVDMKTVIFGDDRKFMKSIFPDTVVSDAWSDYVNPSTTRFVSMNSPSDDLLYSSQHCGSVLISAPVSTFGWWIGYLSKGDRVFYLDVTTVSDVLYESGKMKLDDFFLPKWTALRMSADNTTVIETPSLTATGH